MRENTVAPPKDEINLLDLLITIVESWKLLVIVPIATAGLAWVVVSLMPKEYASTATVVLSNARNEALRSPNLLDLVLSTKNAAGVELPNIEATRAAFLSKLSVSAQDPNTGAVQLTFRQPTPQDAQSQLQQLVDRLGFAKIDETNIEDTKVELATTEEMRAVSIRQNNLLLEALAGLRALAANPGGVPDVQSQTDAEGYARAFIEITNLIRDNEIAIMRLGFTLDAKKQALEELGESGIKVIRPASLETVPLGRSATMVAAFTFVLSSILLLAFVFARDAFRKAGTNAEAAMKMERIRRAFWKPEAR